MNLVRLGWDGLTTRNITRLISTALSQAFAGEKFECTYAELSPVSITNTLKPIGPVMGPTLETG